MTARDARLVVSTILADRGLAADDADIEALAEMLPVFRLLLERLREAALREAGPAP